MYWAESIFRKLQDEKTYVWGRARGEESNVRLQVVLFYTASTAALGNANTHVQ
jgi:hypothetical protein